MEYITSLKARWDYENALAYTEQVAREEERTIAEAKIAEERSRTLAAVRQLKKTGMSNAEIAKETGLSESEVEQA